MTGYLPLCGYSLESTPILDSKGSIVLYTKPILVLTDNFTLSAGELFTMFLQDNQRATVIGMQTDGGGGNVVSYSNVGAYSEGNTRMTQGLVQRLRPVAAPGFPAVPYTDGVGITPDIPLDYMTVSNLNSGGADFFATVTATITKMVQ
jgi:C-terminal processing protease CtpA/Prc